MEHSSGCLCCPHSLLPPRIPAIGKALPQRPVWNAAMAGGGLVIVDEDDEDNAPVVRALFLSFFPSLLLSVDVAAALSLSLFLISSLFSPFSAFSQNADPSYEHASSCGLCLRTGPVCTRTTRTGPVVVMRISRFPGSPLPSPPFPIPIPNPALSTTTLPPPKYYTNVEQCRQKDSTAAETDHLHHSQQSKAGVDTRIRTTVVD